MTYHAVGTEVWWSGGPPPMTDDIEDVPGEPEADDADSQPVDLPADANDGPVPLQAGVEA